MDRSIWPSGAHSTKIRRHQYGALDAASDPNAPPPATWPAPPVDHSRRQRRPLPQSLPTLPTSDALYSDGRLPHNLKELGRVEVLLMRAISSVLSLTSGSARFSLMCSAEVAPGMTATPRLSAQRRSRAAEETPWACATLATSSPFALLDELPSEPYAVTAIPCSWHQLTSW